jgi:hypothetical protein
MILNSPTISGSLTVTGNIIASGSITLSGSVASASFAATASFVALAQSASNAVSAQTASFANTFTVASTLTAQTLVVQTITSSVSFITGSTKFGSIIDNTHQFTGSLYITGSVGINAASSFRFNGIGDTSHAVGYDSTVDGAFLRGQNGVRFITGAGGGTARMTINSNGNVGIGVTPNLNWTNGIATEVGFSGNGIWSRYANEFHLTNNYYFSGSRTYASTNPASDYEQYNGNHTFYTAPSGTAGTAVTLTARMFISSSGNVAIGTTNVGSEANLHLGAFGASEGGQLILQKGTSFTSASHLDNYENQLRIMSGTDTSSSTVRMGISMVNGAVAYGNGGYVDIEWAGGGGASTHTLDLTTAFPNISFSGVQITAVCEVQTVNGTTAGSSHIVMFNRTINGVWASTTISTVNNGGGTISSSSGSGTTLTINHTNAGAMRGQVRVTIRG